MMLMLNRKKYQMQSMGALKDDLDVEIVEDLTCQ